MSRCPVHDRYLGVAGFATREDGTPEVIRAACQECSPYCWECGEPCSSPTELREGADERLRCAGCHQNLIHWGL